MSPEPSHPNRYALSVSFNPEILRLAAYGGLVMLLIVGYVVTHFFVHVPPTETAIYELFGFNHTCNILDYEPSRTITAMLLPFWEIPFLLYLIFHVLRVHDGYREGIVPRYVLVMALAFAPVEILLTVWFRVIFVWSPEVYFLGHYLPYVGFQFLLFLTAFGNVLYFNAVGALPFNRRRLAIAYLVVLSTVTALLITFGLSVALGSPILNSVGNETHRAIFRSLSVSYVVLVIPIPMILSWMELKRSPKHTLTLE
ncbi:MAG: hypothetical protein WEA09_03745 [Gemmatimonadota bacterium]